MKITIGKTTVEIDPRAILYARRSLTYIAQTQPDQRIPGMDRREALKAAAALTRLHAALLKECEEEVDDSEEPVPRKKHQIGADRGLAQPSSLCNVQEKVFTGMPQGVRVFVAQRIATTHNTTQEDMHGIKFNALLEAMEELEHGYDNLAEDIRKIDGFLCAKAEATRDKSAHEAFEILRRLGYEV